MSKSAILRELGKELDIPVIDVPMESPYGVAAKSVAPVQELPKTAPLVPFEQQALKYLITAFGNASPRVQSAFIEHLAKHNGPQFYGAS